MSLSPAAITTIGSFPGTDIWETSRIVRGELPDFPALPELAARGPGADMVGRALGLLAGVSPEFCGQTTPSGWRLTSQTTTDFPRAMRRAASWLSEDLDAAEREWSQYKGPFKIQLAGPWTIAATVELQNGERMLSDIGARRDLAGAMNEAVRLHIADVAKRLPNADIVVQVDEPSVPAVLAGRIQTQSGWSAHKPVEVPDAQGTLRELFTAVGNAGAVPAIHCCGRRPPLRVFREAGAKLVSIDLTLGNTASAADDDEIGQLLDEGLILMAGLASSIPSQVPHQKGTAALLAPLLGVLSHLGIPYQDAASQVVLTPTCGLPGAGSMDRVRSILADLAAASRAMRDVVGDSALRDQEAERRREQS